MKETIDKTKDLVELFPESIQEAIKSWQNVSYIFLSLFALDVTKMGFLVLLLVLDTIFGVAKSMTLFGIKSLKGSMFVNGMLKKTLFLLIPLTLSLIVQGIFVSDVTKIEVWLSIVVTILIIQQAYSVIANIVSMLTGKHIRSKDFVSELLEKIMLLLEHYAMKIKERIDNLFKE